MSKKVLIIGVDGGTWKVLEPAMQKGCMPYLQSLVKNGCSGTLLSTTPPKTAAAWSTFQTGMNPGQNGVFDFAYWDRHTKEAVIVNATALQKTIWEYASEAQKKVAMINVPMTYPLREINGYTVSGLLTPSLQSNFTWPPEFKDELLAAIPGYDILNLNNIKQGTPHEKPALFIDRLKSMVSSRAEVALHLFKKEPFDLFMVHFQESDVIQHAMWGYMQENHPMYSQDICSLIFKELYAHIDKKIQTLHEVFQERHGQDSLLIILSDHGFQTHKKRFNLGKWLIQEGLLTVQKSSFSDLTRDLIHKMRQKRRRRKPIAFDWNASKVFSFSRGNDGFIYLLEESQERRQQTINLIREKIMTVVEPDTQKKIAKEVLLKEEVYSGKYLDRMPDLIIKPADGYSFTGSYTGKKELFQSVTKDNDFHIGMHHQDGIFVAHGYSVHQNATIENARLIDMAPTILAAIGIPVPQQMEGIVLKAIFAEAVEHQTQQSQTPPRASTDQAAYSNKDIKDIERRLRDLGYIE